MDLSPVTQNLGQLATVLGIVAVTKSVAKLLDTVSDQVGLYLEPIHTRRKSQAEAGALKTEATAKAEVSVIKLENKIDIENIKDRAAERVGKREEKRQQNIEAIIKQAADKMPEHVSDESVDEDWVAQFFENCQDVSNEQMQSVWARLLAGEVVKPGSFSRRSLAVVKVMSKADADLFTQFCSTVWQTPEGLKPFVIFSDGTRSIASANLNLDDFIHLDGLGVIRYEGASGFNIRYEFSEIPTTWLYYNKLRILSKNDAIEIYYGECVLTDIGQQLFTISGSSPNEDYRSWVVQTLRGYGWDVNDNVQSLATSAASKTPST